MTLTCDCIDSKSAGYYGLPWFAKLWGVKVHAESSPIPMRPSGKSNITKESSKSRAKDRTDAIVKQLARLALETVPLQCRHRHEPFLCPTASVQRATRLAENFGCRRGGYISHFTLVLCT